MKLLTVQSTDNKFFGASFMYLHFAFFVFSLSAHDSKYSNCTDGEVRLVGGSTEYEGTVQICLNRAWGTVCDRYGFGYEEAQTVCNALGHTTPGSMKHF